MDTIDTFLDAMFSPYPTTPRLLEAKGELRTMMEDAYADAVAAGRTHNEAVGTVITEFGNLEELAPVLGIEPDLRADAAGLPRVVAPASTGSAPARYPVVTLAEAQALADARRRTGSLLGLGVAVCALAAVPLLLVLGASQSPASAGLLALTEDEAVMVGLPLTLLLVALGVILLVRRHRAFAGLEHLTDGAFTQDPVVSAWASRLRVEHEAARSRRLMAALGLWICAAIPVVMTGALSEARGSDDYVLYGTAGTVALVALGLLVYLPASWASATHETLTTEGRPADAGEDWAAVTGVVDVVAAFYWPAVVALYLGWSFLGDAWDRTWIIWPVAGALFGALMAGLGAWQSYRSSRA